MERSKSKAGLGLAGMNWERSIDVYTRELVGSCSVTGSRGWGGVGGRLARAGIIYIYNIINIFATP